jgi:hypothetical protein
VPGKHSWISLLGFCLVTVLGVGLAIAVIVAGGTVALASHQKAENIEGRNELEPAAPGAQSYGGVVTDSRCGARHRRNSGLGPGQCARRCLRLGAGYVLVDGDRRYRLEGEPELLNRLLGARVNLIGRRQGETISVSSASF